MVTRHDIYPMTWPQKRRDKKTMEVNFYSISATGYQSTKKDALW
jgi:hypothetical protein